jgi:hypothetical protein
MRWVWLFISFLVAIAWVNAAGDTAGKLAVVFLYALFLTVWNPKQEPTQ